MRVLEVGGGEAGEGLQLASWCRSSCCLAPLPCAAHLTSCRRRRARRRSRPGVCPCQYGPSCARSRMCALACDRCRACRSGGRSRAAGCARTSRLASMVTGSPLWSGADRHRGGARDDGLKAVDAQATLEVIDNRRWTSGGSLDEASARGLMMTWNGSGARVLLGARDAGPRSRPAATTGRSAAPPARRRARRAWSRASVRSATDRRARISAGVSARPFWRSTGSRPGRSSTTCAQHGTNRVSRRRRRPCRRRRRRRGPRPDDRRRVQRRDGRDGRAGDRESLAAALMGRGPEVGGGA